jgi:hypothetical protein
MSSFAHVWKRRCLVIPALVILITLGLSPAPGFSNTYKIYPTADAYVDSYNGFYNLRDTNYGTETWFSVLSGDKGTYIMFDLTSVVPAGEQITSAALFAHASDRTGSGAGWIQLHPTPTNWSETTITWNNQPGYGPAISSATGGDYATNGWYSWGIPATYLPPSGLVSFALFGADDTNHAIGFDSKELYSGGYPAVDRWPYLQIDTVDIGNIQPPIHVVPLPSTLFLLGPSLIGVGVWRKLGG